MQGLWWINLNGCHWLWFGSEWMSITIGFGVKLSTVMSAIQKINHHHHQLCYFPLCTFSQWVTCGARHIFIWIWMRVVNAFNWSPSCRAISNGGEMVIDNHQIQSLKMMKYTFNSFVFNQFPVCKWWSVYFMILFEFQTKWMIIFHTRVI